MGTEATVTQADIELAERLCWGRSEAHIAEAAMLIARHRTAASQASDAGGWLPIDSAPMTGETILAICASAYTPTAFDTWWQDGWTHYSRPDDKWHGGVGKWFPTHWMPREAYLATLTAPPTSDAGEEDTNRAADL